ncbi:MAG: hypothetical protein K2M36_05965, partial [Clostridia bacterium]|nr:hypothetical protein [Clostridia bacterium]
FNTAPLANSGVKIDGTYGINGYQNSSQINATDNAVAVTVKFIPYSAEFAFIDEHGQQADDQFEIYTLYVKVDKATIDFTKLEWSADELEFTGMYQTVTLVSGLPSFITPVYSGNTQSALGDYTAEISRLNVTDQEAAKNYVVPTNTSTIPTHKWSIIKKKVVVSWIDSETSTGDGHNIIFVPTFADNSTGAVVYSYYPALAGDSSKPDKDKPLSIDDITGSYDATKTTKYFACAKIREGSGGTGGVNIFDSSNCTLVLDGEEVAEAYQSFEIGDNKNPIRVSLKTDKTVYNGQAQPAEVEIEGAGFAKENLEITYKVKNADGDFVAMDDPTNPEPLYAGEYKVCVAVGTHHADTFAISGQREFDYVIEKADIDLSDMKWVDTDNENAEYTAPYTYKPGVTHKLVYVGNSLDDFDGLKMDFTSESVTNAGKYTITVTFTVEDADIFNENYNVPET